MTSSEDGDGHSDDDDDDALVMPTVLVLVARLTRVGGARAAAAPPRLLLPPPALPTSEMEIRGLGLPVRWLVEGATAASLAFFRLGSDGGNDRRFGRAAAVPRPETVAGGGEEAGEVAIVAVAEYPDAVGAPPLLEGWWWFWPCCCCCCFRSIF